MALHESFTLTIIPDVGYAVDTIRVDSAEYINNNQTILPDGSSWTTFILLDVSAEHTIIVSFAADTDGSGIPDKYKYTVTAIAEEGGTASPESQLVVHGGDASIDITPDMLMAVDTITANGVTYVNDGNDN